MRWYVSYRTDDRVRPLADRHYNRQKIGAVGFVPPGMCLVFRTENNTAVWTSSWPFAEYVRHEWAGAWVNSLFRNESGIPSSELITEALAATCYHWTPPSLGMVTFVDPECVPGVMRRGERIFGYCYLKAGWKHIGFTKGGLWTWQILPAEMPKAQQANGVQIGFNLLKPKERKP